MLKQAGYILWKSENHGHRFEKWPYGIFEPRASSYNIRFFHWVEQAYYSDSFARTGSLTIGVASLCQILPRMNLCSKNSVISGCGARSEKMIAHRRIWIRVGKDFASGRSVTGKEWSVRTCGKISEANGSSFPKSWGCFSLLLVVAFCPWINPSEK